MENKDLARFKHMLDSTQAILSFVKGKRRTSLDKERVLVSAILREFEIIGEAANRISKKTQEKFSEIPWKELVGMRNRLIHAYFDVDYDIIWKTIREYLPDFQKQLKAVIVSLSKELSQGMR